jgi:hypothetical protein
MRVKQAENTLEIERKRKVPRSMRVKQAENTLEIERSREFHRVRTDDRESRFRGERAWVQIPTWSAFHRRRTRNLLQLIEYQTKLQL